MTERIAQTYGVGWLGAAFVCQSLEFAKYFEEAARECSEPKLVLNWLMTDVSRKLNQNDLAVSDFPVPASLLAKLINRVTDGTISNNGARQVFEDLWNAPQNPDGSRLLQDIDAIIEVRGLKQMSDTGELDAILDAVLAANPKSVEEFRAGKDKAFNALVGQAMKASKGKANPAQVNELLKKKLTTG